MEASAVTVQSDSSEVSDLISGRQVGQLAINGRNIAQLATLTPGLPPICPILTFQYRWEAAQASALTANGPNTTSG